MFDNLYANVPNLSVSVPLFGTFDATPYLIAVGIFVALMILFRVVLVSVLAKLEMLAARTRTDIDGLFIRMVQSIRPWAYTTVAFIVALLALQLPSWLSTILIAALLFVLLLQVVRALTMLIEYAVSRFVASDTDGDDPHARTAAHMLTLLGRIILWSVGLLFVLSNLGVEITSLIAGLGIGGIAIGLALQAILGDLFSSFAIYFDKPFRVGDFIIVGDQMGTVERIGIKTTRLRALQGEEVVISNAELTSARIHNYKRMSNRRIVFQFGIAYETPPELVAQVPERIREIFASLDRAELERAHFAAFGASALTFEVVYNVLASDYATYMDVQQQVNLSLMECFAHAGINFAYPTQTLYIHKAS